MDPSTLARTLLVFLSAPVKPGAVHRLTPGREFEARLVEAYIIAGHMADAYEAGRRLARGEVDAEGVGLGRLIHSSLVKSLEATELEPIVGLHVAAIVLAAASGYLGASKLHGSLSKALSALLYTKTVEASEDLVGGLEAVGASDLLSRLYDEGITKTQIRAYSIDLGTIFEKLSQADTGFWLNISTYKRVLEVAGRLKGSKTVAEAAVNAYLELLSALGAKVRRGSVKDLLEADRALRRKGFKGERILGAAFAAVAIAVDSEIVERLA